MIIADIQFIFPQTAPFFPLILDSAPPAGANFAAARRPAAPAIWAGRCAIIPRRPKSPARPPFRCRAAPDFGIPVRQEAGDAQHSR